MISLQSSAKEHDKFQSMVGHVMENEPERPHGEVSATPSNEPSRVTGVILSAIAGNALAWMRYTEERKSYRQAPLGLPEKTVSYEWFQVQIQ